MIIGILFNDNATLIIIYWLNNYNRHLVKCWPSRSLRSTADGQLLGMNCPFDRFNSKVFNRK